MTDKSKETTDSLIQMAIQHHNAGHYAKAEALYRQVLEINPDEPDANNLMGTIAHMAGQHETARKLIKKAVDLQPNNPVYCKNYAVIAANSGDHLDAARSYWLADEFAEAEKQARLAIEQAPDNIEAYQILGRALRDQEKFREGEEAFYKALDLMGGPVDEREFPVPIPIEPQPISGEKDPILPCRETSGFTYVLDIVGTCNLRCPSCPVGNMPDTGRSKGFMEIDYFRKVLDKIKSENHKELPRLWFFNWGEPLMHPKIGEFIRIAKDQGFYVMLSSNLNTEVNIKEAIKANPDELKISLSGFNQDIYGQTHKTGNIALVKANMHFLRYYLDKYQSKTWVWVSYHIYRHNIGDYDLMENLANSLGFNFLPIMAFYQPLEKMLDMIQNKVADGENDVIDKLIMHPLDLHLGKRQVMTDVKDCELRYNMTTINHDGTVALCCGVYRPENMLNIDFLEHDFDEIQALKYEHSFCETCYKHDLQFQFVNDEYDRYYGENVHNQLQSVMRNFKKKNPS